MISFEAADLHLHRTMESLGGAAGQDGLAFIVAQPDKKNDMYQTAVWYLRPSGFESPRRLTSLSFDAKSPSLAPDGRSLAFISTRDHKQGPQVHTIPVDGGEAVALSSLKSEPLKIQMWSPDGNALLVTVKTPWAEDEFDDPQADEQSRPRVASFLPYKADGAGTRVGHRYQLRRIDAKSGESTTLLAGDFNVDEAQWSPDGRQLAFIRNRSGSQRHWTDLWIADADGGNARRVTEEVSSIGGPRWSPDGRRIAFAGTRREGDSMTNLWIYDLDRDELHRPAGNGVQLEGQWIIWHPDGDRIATVVARRGLHEVGVIRVADGRLERFHAGLRHVHALCCVKDRLVAVYASVRRLDEIESVLWDGSDRRRHTAFNLGWFSERERPRAIKRRFAVPDGNGGTEKVDAWLLLPPHREGPFPLLVDMHGGPASVALIDFPNHVYWYELCARGWAILAPNAVGSGSYGPEFARRLVGHWGELDLPQHLAIVDCLQKEGIADLRVACTGKSYGGFLSAWAIGQSSRFTSAVVCAPVANIESHAGTSDTGYYVTPFAMGEELSEGDERYHALSPIRYCHGSHTPTLILQGERDERCPKGQSEELFASLVRCARAPARMVMYPMATHDLSASGKPSQRLDYHRRLAAWVQQWTAEEAAREADGATQTSTGQEASA